MKTVCITSFQGLISRILEGGVVDVLLEDGDVRIVILVPKFKLEYFKKILGQKERVYIEGVEENQLSRIARLFHAISFMLLDTHTMRLIRRSPRDYSGFLRYIATQGFARLFGHSRTVRKFFRFLNYYFSGKPLFEDIFQRYAPVCVLSMDIKHPLDTKLVIEAKKKGITTVGMVRSWDYLTAKGVIRVQPEKMIVHNSIIAKEAMQYADMEERDIEIIGMPHFDAYVNEKRSSKKEFFNRIGVPENKKLIILAVPGNKFSDIDSDFYDIFCRTVEEDVFAEPVHILVRVPPGDSVPGGEGLCDALSFDIPGVQFGDFHRKANEMSYNDVLHLANVLHFADVLVTTSSTLIIDAAVFDVPTVYLGFDGYKRRPYIKSIRHYFDYDHAKHIISANGGRMANSPGELIAHVNHYLKHPEDEQAGRKKIVDEQCFLLDGNASKRLAQFVRAQLP
ncbi:hypothetical protein COU17_03385 [Candidatus Kaiserbacteria bacterium CG10_big_fil_rev_8_21_14_0_10_49_17]|uniref:UDP-N-acetylglucosamine 2-epimerase domain-containing protein n=1 Tax=Candidatus Kaiserbacteria bacterium CG10_big_fil_rev_8_21_14_0_10_49_17 TaxID=1974609 RepID=A0A2M6WDU8_9BACT|nr:MAG: hypothetical protein COU17_03385 [Candidatus Kaiserbacteria bacterium CG10_big_fil_rev_8_21_14_0_10_49_17]